MVKMGSYLFLFGMGIVTFPCLLFLAGIARCRCRSDIGKYADNSMHEKLRESRMALDKARSLIQRALEDEE